jgi:hypothetical protein
VQQSLDRLWTHTLHHQRAGVVDVHDLPGCQAKLPPELVRETALSGNLITGIGEKLHDLGSSPDRSRLAIAMGQRGTLQAGFGTKLAGWPG